MRRKKLRAQQQLKQAQAMQQDTQLDPTTASFLNNPNIPSSESAQAYHVELEPWQASFLTRLLPAFYSFQADTKPLKRAVSTQKIPKEEPKIPAQTKKKGSKSGSSVLQEEIKPAAPTKLNSNRSNRNNSNKVSEEIQNAVYEKYTTQKEVARRTSFENVGQNLRPCIRLLTLLKNSKTSWPFREPVDPIALGIPHYTEIVKQPMDLSTIEHNLRTNQYITPTQFHADVSKIITNSYTFNSSNIQFTRITAEFEAYYRKITTESTGDLQRGYSQNEMQGEIYREKAVVQHKKSERKKEDSFSQPMAPSISMAEKKELGLNIKRLPKEYMKGILDIVNEGKVKIIGEFDLKQLDPFVIRKLQAYVRQKLSSESKNKPVFGQDHNENKEESSFELDEEDES